MRKRKRPDWQIKCYKYELDLIGEPPSIFWDIAKSMRNAWNRLVDLRTSIQRSIQTTDAIIDNLLNTDLSTFSLTESFYLQVSQKVKSFIKHDQERDSFILDQSIINQVVDRLKVGDLTHDQLKAEYKKTYWSTFDLASKAIVKDPSLALNWECQSEILDRFTRATVAGKHPKKQFRFDSINIPHYYTGGGREISKVFTESSHTLYLQPIDFKKFPDAYLTQKNKSRTRASRGYFGLGKDSEGNHQYINFKVNLHRQIESLGFIKRCNLVGRYNCLGWKYSLVLTVEVEPSNIQTVLPASECGLDLGWRCLGDYIRLGYLVDDQGNEQELKLPITLTAKRFKKYNERYPDNRVINDWMMLKDFHQQLCYQVDNTKALLQKSLPKQLPQEIHDVLKGFHKMRQGGLYKIRRILKENPTVAPESLHELELFAYDDLYIKRKIQRGLDRLIGFREWHYRNLALQLATNYSTIYWESDLNIKALAEGVNDKDAKLDPNFDKSKHYFIKNSMEFRHIAALGIFRLYLINACKKTGSTLYSTKSKNTTALCCICSESVNTSQKLENICINGHLMDQDKNAAKNLLNQGQRLKYEKNVKSASSK